MGYAVLFPGQGSQFRGMGADLFEARPDLVGETADAVLGFSLRQVCLDGPEEELTRTEHAQPALFALAFALWDSLSGEVPPPAAAAGHSLGEYTALTAAGAFAFGDALAVVAARGKAMAAAADAEPSAMAAVLGADLETVEEVCLRLREEGARVWVANINAPGQVVVAGGAGDIARVAADARELGLRRVVPLAVAGGFHSSFMGPAVTPLADALAGVDAGPLRFPVYANATAAAHTPGTVIDTLIDQVVMPVRFSESLVAMAAAGVDTFVHVGPGDVTAGLARRTVSDATVHVVSTLDDIGPVAEALAGG